MSARRDRGALDRLRVPTSEHAAPGTEVEVEIFGRWIAGEVSVEPLLDPDGRRMRA